MATGAWAENGVVRFSVPVPAPKQSCAALQAAAWMPAGLGGGRAGEGSEAGGVLHFPDHSVLAISKYFATRFSAEEKE